VNRIEGMQVDAGGKGVNVASFLADFGMPVTVTGFLGDQNPQLFEKLFLEKHITDRFIRVPGATRTNIKIVDARNQQTTDINQAGQPPTAQVMAALFETLAQLAEDHTWFVLSGNILPGAPADIYAQMIWNLRAKGRQVALDTSRDALLEGLKAVPEIAKPNIDELRQLTGAPLNSLTEVEAAARQLQATGIGLVVVSMGGEGALFVDGQQTILAVPPAVTLKTTVGAGDAMVAGLIAGKCQGFDLAECARLATAFSLGAITHIGAHLPDASTLAAYQHQVQIKQIANHLNQ